MSNIDNQIRSRVQDFVNELSVLVRSAALRAVEVSLGGGGASAARPRPGRPAAPSKAAPVAASAGRGRATRRAGKLRKGEKRSPEQLVQLTKKLGDYIHSNGGQGIEAIARSLGTSTKELALPVRKLLADKKITSKGQKRATRYFPR